MSCLFCIATKLNKEEGVVQVSSLVNAMGREANQFFLIIHIGPAVERVDPTDDFDTVLGEV